MRINDFLDGVKAGINTALPKLKSCELHGGRFSESELKRMSASTPAIYIADMGMPTTSVSSDGCRIVSLTMAAFVVTKRTRKMSANAAANNIVEALLNIIPLNSWGNEWAADPERLGARNMYGGDIRADVALWVVGWQQAVQLDDSKFNEANVVPERLYVGLAPQIGKDNENEYTEVEG